MGSTPYSLRCVRCKRVSHRAAGRQLELIGHEVRVTYGRARRGPGAGTCHRALARCLTCGHVMLTTHPSAAVPAGVLGG